MSDVTNTTQSIGEGTGITTVTHNNVYGVTNVTTVSDITNIGQSTEKELNVKKGIKTENPNRIKVIELDYELEYQEPCRRNQYKEEFKECNTWNQTLCNSPCKTSKCPTFAKCKDTSNDTHPLFECVCQLGTEMKDDSQACIAPQIPDPTPRYFFLLP